MRSASWDCCTLHSLYIIGGIIGVFSLNDVLMGPPPQCSGLCLVIGVNCNIFYFGVIAVPLFGPGDVERLHAPATRQWAQTLTPMKWQLRDRRTMNKYLLYPIADTMLQLVQNVNAV